MPEPIETQEPALPPTPPADADREERAVHEIYKHAVGSFVAGMIPAPGFDLAAVTAIQLKMLHAISKLYGIPFTKNAAQSVIASLIGGLGATALARGTFGSLVKMIPLIGPLAGPVVLPAMAVGATYAVGKVFIRHFESGGTLLDFDPAEARAHFSKLYQEGKSLATSLGRGAKTKPPAEPTAHP